jgi:hypothetical protein
MLQAASVSYKGNHASEIEVSAASPPLRCSRSTYTKRLLICFSRATYDMMSRSIGSTTLPAYAVGVCQQRPLRGMLSLLLRVTQSSAAGTS